MTLRYDRVSSALGETLLGKPQFTGPEAAAEAGIDQTLGEKFWRALGFPHVPRDQKVFTRGDVEALKIVRSMMEHDEADAEVLLQITRVSGQALSRMLAVQILPISHEISDAMRSSAKTDTEAANAVVSASESMMTTVIPFLNYAWRRHLLARVAQTAASATPHLGDEANHAVAFADIVGFTAQSQQLSDREIARTISRFETLAYEHIPEHGGTVIKMIGDEVMFTTANAAACAEISLGLVEAAALDDVVPDLRVGMATGPTVAWGGDVYGPTVNLASRLVNVAHPGTVLVSEDAAVQLEEAGDFDLRSLPRMRLKGIGKTRPRVVRRKPS